MKGRGLRCAALLSMVALLGCEVSTGKGGGTGSPSTNDTAVGDSSLADGIPGLDGGATDDTGPVVGIADTSGGSGSGPDAAVVAPDGSVASQDIAQSDAGGPDEDASTSADSASGDDVSVTPEVCATDQDCASMPGTGPCTVAKCKPSTNKCVLADAPDGKGCDDGDACSTETVCSSGVCGGGAVVDCDDGDVCTDDACDPLMGCAYVPNEAPCTDGDPCTVGDACANGECIGSENVCDDGDPCTQDLCDGGGCQHVAATGPCDDGDPCTVDDACADGVCGPGKQKACDDGDGCSIDWCDVATGECKSQPGCPAGQVCDEAAGVCVSTCADSCAENECGDDGCGGSCGTCGAGKACYEGTCKASCTPSCGGKSCGSDGCGGTCGSCAPGSTCSAGTCVAGCTPSCGGKQCGDDGCGGSCGACPDGIQCTVGGFCGNGCTVCEANPTCSNLSFESGNLSGWTYSAAQVIKVLGDAQPTDGKYMLQLTTGTSQTEQSSDASFQLCLPDGGHVISMDWKLLSEEFVEWCGSQFQDAFQARITGANGDVTLVDVKIDDLCEPSSCPGCGSAYEGLWAAPVSFDQGDVYETPWITTVVPFNLNGGGVAKLELVATDAGDSIYDSVVLVDNIQIDSCTPSCTGKSCGGDGCGGSCGSCAPGDFCSEGACVAGCPPEMPVAVINVQEGEEVIPQTVIHLKGDQSFGASGGVKKWSWSVTQPVGSQSVFTPSSTFPNPTFEANSAGTYQFKLDVWDGAGNKSCEPAVAEVVAIPDEAIHVELHWNTPNDPDQTDEGPEAGADVDLHFLHPYASGPDLDGDGVPDGWFDQPFDCFWFNPTPNWGSFDPSVDDDPGLDRDDTDGAGPENLNLNIPEDGKTYRIGVHYWHDHGYGPSYVTLRIYIYAMLVWEVKDLKLVNHDMWDAATIEWESGQVTSLTTEGGLYKITPDYQNPFFFQP